MKQECDPMKTAVNRLPFVPSAISNIKTRRYEKVYRYYFRPVNEYNLLNGATGLFRQRI